MMHRLLAMMLISLAINLTILFELVWANNLLNYETFKLKTTIHYVESGVNYMAFTMEERYSFDQYRAIVKFKRKYCSDECKTRQDERKNSKLFAQVEAGTYFLDKINDRSLIMSAGTNVCSQLDVIDFQQALELEFLTEIIDLGAQNHVVGPVLIMFYIMNNKQALRLTNYDLGDGSVERRNIKSVDYSLSIPIKENGFGNNIELLVSFDRTSFAKESANAIPHHVELTWNGPTRRQLIIDYSQVVILKGSNIFDQQREAMQPIVYDSFILPPISGCSQALIENNGEPKSLFDGMDSNWLQYSIRFSFRAQIEYPQSVAPRTNDANGKPNRKLVDKFEKFVAYDSRLNMMRVDVGQSDFMVSNIKEIFNFQQNQLFCIMGQHWARENLLFSKYSADSRPSVAPKPADDLSDPTSILNDLSGQCVVTKIDSSANPKPSHTLDQLLVGSDHFVPLGRANVRGIDCLVYESAGQRSQPPYWLEQPSSYKDLSRSQGDYLVNDDRRTRWPFDGSLGLGGEGGGGSGQRLISLVYVAEQRPQQQQQQQQQQPDSRMQIIAIELYRTDLASVVVYERRIIMIYDFMWDLNDKLLNGQPISELFALHNDCSVQLATNGKQAAEHYNIGLLLETDDITNWNSLKEAMLLNLNVRNFAILAELQQNLDLSANLIYNLNSQLIDPVAKLRSLGPPTTGSDKQSAELLESSAYISVQFQVASESRVQLELERFGFGRSVLGANWYYRMHSFQTCYLLAAHRKRDVYFAYDSRTRYCLIGIKTIPSTGGNYGDEIEGFQLDPIQKNSQEPIQRGQVEIFRTRHASLKPIKYNHWAQENAYQGDRLHLMNKKLTLMGTLSGKTTPIWVEFNIKRLTAHGFRPTKVSVAGLDTTSANGPGPETIVHLIDGVGFDLSDQENFKHLKHIPKHKKYHLNINLNDNKLPGGDNDDSDSEPITLKQCQAACAADLDCQSYSVCIRGFEIHCGLSNVSFRLPQVVEKLQKASQLQATTGGKFKLELGLTQKQNIKLIRHPNCAIHNKRYMDYFGSSRMVSSSLHGHRLFKVKEIEECASVCTKENLLAIKSHMDRMCDLLANRGPTTRAEGPGGGLELPSRRQLNRSLLEKICIRFLFISSLDLEDENNDEMIESIKRYAANEIDDGASDELDLANTGNPGEQVAITGYCAIPVKLNEKISYENLSTNQLRLEQYEFNLNTFYEPTYGISLKGSKTSKEEMAAMASAAFSRSKNLDSKQLDLLSSFIERGDNSQLIYPRGDATICSTLCLMQTMGPWPSCKSFDIIMELEEEEKGAQKQLTLVCRLNSITLAQAMANKRFDLIDDDDDNSRNGISHSRGERWHYDPRPGFVEDTSTLGALIEFNEARDSVESRHDESVIMICIVLLFKTILTLGCLIIGLLMGALATKQLISTFNLTIARRKGSAASQIGVLEIPVNIVELEERNHN